MLNPNSDFATWSIAIEYQLRGSQKKRAAAMAFIGASVRIIFMRKCVRKMADYPSKCHTCGLLVRNFLAGFQCLIAGCTNPLAGPEARAANQAKRKYDYNRSPARRRSKDLWQRHNRGQCTATQRVWKLAHRDRNRATRSRYLRKTKVRLKVSAYRRKRYAESAEIRAKEAKRTRAYRERQKAAGKVFALQADGTHHWVQLNTELGNLE